MLRGMKYNALGVLGLLAISLFFINSTDLKKSKKINVVNTMNPSQKFQDLISNKDTLSLPKESPKVVKTVLEASQALEKNKSLEQQWRLLEKSRYDFNFLDKEILFQQHWVDVATAYSDQHEGSPKSRTIDRHIYDFVNQDPKTFKNHKTLEAFLFKRASSTEVHDISKPKQENPAVSLLKKMNTLDKLTQHMTESYDALTHKLIQGDFSDQSKTRLLITRFEAMDQIKTINLAKFYLPLVLAGDIQYLDKLKTVNKTHVSKASNLLLDSKPKKPYWLAGRWDQDNLDQLKQLAPSIFNHLEKSIAAFKKNNTYRDTHINPFALKKISKQ